MELELTNKRNSVEPQDNENSEETDSEIEEYNNEQEKIHISRSQLIGSLKFPESTPKRQIVMPNNEGLGFRLDSYNEEAFNGRLTESEYRKNIYELTKICSLEFAKKLHRERTDPFQFEKSMLLWNIPLLGMAVLLFALRVFDFVINDFTFEIGLALFGIDIAAVIVNFVKSQIKKPDLTSFIDQSYKELSKKLIEINEVFRNKNLRFTLHKKVYWINIFID